MGRISSNLRPSRAQPFCSTSSRSPFSELLEGGLGFDLSCTSPPKGPDKLAQHLIDRPVIGELVAHAHGIGQRNHHLLFHLAVEGRVVLLLRGLSLGLAGFFRERVDRLDDALNRGVAGLEALHHVFFGYFLGSGPTITIASLLPAITRSSELFLRCSYVGLITY